MRLQLVDSLPGDFIGVQEFGTNVLKVLRNLSSDDAAAIAAHEFKHYLQNLTPETYTQAAELEARVFEANARGTTIDIAKTLQFIRSHVVYGNLPPG